MHQAFLWGGFILFVLVMISIDLGLFHRKSHAVKTKEALIWCAVWVSLALLFNVGVYHYRGSQAGVEFLTGYLIELSLSLDNLFVFLLIFSFFRVPKHHQHSVLYWGILGALVMRAIMIMTGIALINNFHWIIYVFGAFLVFTGVKMFFTGDQEIHPEKNIVIRLAKKIFPVTHEFHEGHFFVRLKGRLLATPLFLVLLVIETTDLVFAVDSIPAILAITRDSFIVYTSNVFAILGLRSFYFALAGMFDKFRFLKVGLAIVLTYVGLKMLLADIYKIPTILSLTFIALTIGLSILISFFKPEKTK
ncbi:MAG: TerC family protein [candidate division Zixibacteria bacterium]|nr:TerC family protein [candidate division Zixibacteria bacterium]